MKLLRIKIPDDLKQPFRSLHPGFTIQFNPNLNSKDIEPIGLAGLNGSGKSNLLELASEIFYYLDSQHLEFPTPSVKDEKVYGFEIDYALPFTFDNPFITFDSPGYTFDDKYFVVRIIKPIDGYTTYAITSANHYLKELDRTKLEDSKKFKADWKSIEFRDKNKQINKNISQLLPRKVFAYTSGNNELLSNSYYKMQFHYFNDYKRKLKTGSKFYFDSSRLFFSDLNSNASVFIANYLLGEKKAIEYINDVVKVKDLHSFRITIRYADRSGSRMKEIKFNQDLDRRVKLLKNCATTWYEKGTASKRVLTLDYLVTDATKKAFEKTFGESPFDLFKTFYELEMQNFYALPNDILEMVSEGPKWLNISDELPKPNPNHLVFRIEKIKIFKQGVDDEFYYKGLSDGEHQFLQVVGLVMMIEESGCLFLFDEPDTHYNPIWRSKLVNTINQLLKKQNGKKENQSRLQELLITTHSPFVVSDLRKRNVYLFEKPKTKVKFKPCHFETYGASASIIMDEIFGKENSISEMAKSDLKKLEKPKSIDQLMQIVAKLNNDFGESVEKFDLFSKLREIKKQMEQ